MDSGAKGLKRPSVLSFPTLCDPFTTNVHSLSIQLRKSFCSAVLLTADVFVLLIEDESSTEAEISAALNSRS